MKKFFDYFAILADNFQQNASRTLAILEFVVNEQWDELAKFVKVKFLGKLIDIGITAVPAESSAKTITELLRELENALKEKGLKFGSYKNGKFYHPDILDWFPDAKISKTPRTLQLAELPKGGMLEKEMIAEAKTLKMNHKHSLVEYIKATITLVKNNYFKKNSTWTVGFLEEKKNDKFSCAFFAFLRGGGEFCLDVDKVNGSHRWLEGNGFFLSNN